MVFAAGLSGSFLFKSPPSPLCPLIPGVDTTSLTSLTHPESDVISSPGIDFFLFIIIVFSSSWLQPFMQGLQRMVCSAFWFYVFLWQQGAILKPLVLEHF